MYILFSKYKFHGGRKNISRPYDSKVISINTSAGEFVLEAPNLVRLILILSSISVPNFITFYHTVQWADSIEEDDKY